MICFLKINTFPTDQRQMSNTGPFRLEKDKPVDIVVAYVIGRGKTSALESVETAKKIDKMAQFIYGNNFIFPTPPAVHAKVITEDDAITIVWNTADQVNFKDSTEYYDMFFEGYEVKMFQNGTTNNLNNNMRVIARYDIADEYNDIYEESANSPSVSLLYSKGTQLDKEIYKDPATGWLSLRIDKDPFTNGPLIKGKPYFISITAYALNKKALIKYNDDPSDSTYVLSRLFDIKSSATSDAIIKGPHSFVGIVPGSNSYDPYTSSGNTEHVKGSSETNITYSVINKDSTTTDKYEVGFFLDSLSTVYSLFYYVKDTDTDTMLGDSLKNYNDEAGITAMYDGVTLNVEWKEPGIKDANFISGGNWAKPMNRPDTTGAFYVGSDIEGTRGVPLLVSKTTKAVRASDMRRIEIRFGTHGKAYRYTNGIVGGRPTGKMFYGGVVDGRGFVDVPFTAWIKDDKFGEERQLAVAFTEDGFDSTGRSDANWNPGSDISKTKEYIIVFNSDYSENGDNLVYTGIPSETNMRKWARIDGYDIPTNDSTYVVTDSMKFIAKNAYFDALAVVGVETTSNDTNFVPSDGILEVPINYVLTPADVYTYNVKLNLDDDEAKSKFDKVNVYPNPLFAYNAVDSYKYGSHYSSDSPHITFTNLPNEVTISIYTLSGVKIRELTKNDTNPFLDWDLKNYDGLRAASGMYIAVVHSPKYGDKVLKFAIIMPQKQIRRY